MSTDKKEWSRRVFLNRSSQAAAGVVASMLASSSILEAGSLWPTDSTYSA